MQTKKVKIEKAACATTEPLTTANNLKIKHAMQLTFFVPSDTGKSKSGTTFSGATEAS